MAKPNKKKEALALLSRNVPQTRVAELIGVDRRTIVRWLKLPDFRKELFDSRRGHLESVLDQVAESSESSEPSEASSLKNEEIQTSQVDLLIAKSITALDAILSCPESRNADRIRASELVLKLVGTDRVARSFSDSNNSDKSHNLSPEERERKINELLERRLLIDKRRSELESQLAAKEAAIEASNQ